MFTCKLGSPVKGAVTNISWRMWFMRQPRSIICAPNDHTKNNLTSVWSALMCLHALTLNRTSHLGHHTGAALKHIHKNFCVAGELASQKTVAVMEVLTGDQILHWVKHICQRTEFNGLIHSKRSARVFREYSLWILTTFPICGATVQIKLNLARTVTQHEIPSHITLTHSRETRQKRAAANNSTRTPSNERLYTGIAEPHSYITEACVN